METTYTVYGTRRSYFTMKLESAMSYYGVPWRHVTKGPENSQLIETRSGTHQIPVLHTPENWMINDTTPIISMMDARYPLRRLVPTGPLAMLAAHPVLPLYMRPVVLPSVSRWSQRS